MGICSLGDSKRNGTHLGVIVSVLLFDLGIGAHLLNKNFT
jgi:hypothetical protein